MRPGTHLSVVPGQIRWLGETSIAFNSRCKLPYAPQPLTKRSEHVVKISIPAKDTFFPCARAAVIGFTDIRACSPFPGFLKGLRGVHPRLEPVARATVSICRVFLFAASSDMICGRGTSSSAWTVRELDRVDF